MSKRVFPRSWDSLAIKAAEVHQSYASAVGWVPSLPVPVEDIIERLYDLRILWKEIDEEPGEILLAMLVPEHRTIVINELHVNDIFETVGPLNFTLAHELGHWLFDAVSPEQGRLFDAAGEPVFCRGSHSSNDSTAVREGNADRFAASLLLPRALLPLDDLVTQTYGELRGSAHAFGVSTKALQIRIQQLALPPSSQPSLY